MTENNWDYIIVGGGSAGCVLANRLSADSRNSVLLLEAGGTDSSPVVRVPAGEMKAIMSRKYNWTYIAEPDPSRNNRADMWPAGKVLGGGSSINGMMYVRGNRRDYDHWAELGNNGWDYESVLPYFRRAETNENGENKFRGGSGPLSVSNSRAPHLLTDVFVKAGVEIGLPYNPDPNGERQEGIGRIQATQKDGWRHSTSQAYIRPVRGRKNLTIVTDAYCERVVVEGARATGVTYTHQAYSKTAFARKEVIVSAGAIASPKLLMLSGIGPAAELREHDIQVMHDLPGVGKNLQEHPGIMMSQHVNVRTLNMEATPLRTIWHGLNFVLRGRGPGTASIGHAAAFVRIDPDSDGPEVQISYAPIVYDFNDGGLTLYNRPAICAAVNVCRPESRGSITLASKDPYAPPRIRHELVGSERDMRLLIDGCRVLRRVFNADAFTPYRINERLPGPEVQTEDEWRLFIKRDAFLMYHPAGTCRMGADSLAVVDSRLRVHGIHGLRVVDASVMPILPSANTNAPTIMIAEKASDLILEDGANK
ncbi:GMC family oxidoreductase N-terminal domain-containing protein [Paraburkholderia sediminicola]|uniref:GMC family oxidoreductase N-terminal domain-containing protein n=1 Tax=Paraburkholderia metrosideri TaxID=580937 RepID=A0ABW9DZL0_9BURK